MNLNKKTQFMIGSILALVFVLTLSLGLIKTPWKFSYLDLFQNLKAIKTERQQTEQIKNDIARTKSDLAAKEQTLKDLDRDFTMQKEALKIQGKFDLPSLLVILDQEAEKQHLELIIYYDLITFSDKQPGKAPNPAEQSTAVRSGQQVSKQQNSPGEPSNQASSPSNKLNPPNSNQSPNSSSSTASPPSSQKPSDNQASSSGTKQVPDFGLKEKLSEAGAAAADLKTTVLPVSVSGDFKSIRSYLTYLQGLNYVRIYAVRIQPDRADIVLQVFSVGQ